MSGVVNLGADSDIAELSCYMHCPQTPQCGTVIDEAVYDIHICWMTRRASYRRNLTGHTWCNSCTFPLFSREL